MFSLQELRRLFTNKIGLQHLVTRSRGDLPIEPSTGLISSSFDLDQLANIQFTAGKSALRASSYEPG